MGGGLLALFGSNLIDVITFVTGLSIRKVLGIIKSFGQSQSSEFLKPAFFILFLFL